MPGLPSIRAAEEHARFAARVDGPICWTDGNRENILLRQLHILPGLSAVAALPDSLAICTGIECARVMRVERQALSAAIFQCQYRIPGVTLLCDMCYTVSSGSEKLSHSRISFYLNSAFIPNARAQTA